jgi:hypothetical protein
MLNLSLVLLAKSNRSMVKNWIPHSATHGLSLCLNTSSSILKFLDQNKGFSFTYLCKFVFKSHIEVVDYSSLKINKTWKNVRTIKEQERNSKGKSVEAEKEVCSSI